MISKRTTNKLDDSFVNSLVGPARFIPIVLGFFIFNESLNFNAYFGSLLIIIAGANAIYGLKNAN